MRTRDRGSMMDGLLGLLWPASEPAAAPRPALRADFDDATRLYRARYASLRDVVAKSLYLREKLRAATRDAVDAATRAEREARRAFERGDRVGARRWAGRAGRASDQARMSANALKTLEAQADAGLAALRSLGEEMAELEHAALAAQADDARHALDALMEEVRLGTDGALDRVRRERAIREAERELERDLYGLH